MLLSEFDIAYVSQKAIKESVIVDFLTDRAINDYEPMNFDYPNEYLKTIFQIEKEEPIKEK